MKYLEGGSNRAGRPEGWGHWGRLDDEATSRQPMSNLRRRWGRATSDNDLDHRSLMMILTESDLGQRCSCFEGLRRNGVAVFRFALGLRKFSDFFFFDKAFSDFWFRSVLLCYLYWGLVFFFFFGLKVEHIIFFSFFFNLRVFLILWLRVFLI